MKLSIITMQYTPAAHVSQSQLTHTATLKSWVSDLKNIPLSKKLMFVYASSLMRTFPLCKLIRKLWREPPVQVGLATLLRPVGLNVSKEMCTYQPLHELNVCSFRGQCGLGKGTGSVCVCVCVCV